MRTSGNKWQAFVSRTWFSCMVLCIVFFCCSEKQSTSIRYDAEKALFQARKLRSELTGQLMISGTEFLDRTLMAYRNIVSTYESRMKEVEGLEMIVVSAQMELAELTYYAAMLPEASNEFEKAFTLAENIPEARAAGLYFASHISEQIEEYHRAIPLYERFYELYLKPEKISSTAAMNDKYTIVPLKLAELSLYVGDEEGEKKWLEKAEAFYSDIISKEHDPELLKVTRYNLLATYLQGRKWDEGLEIVKKLLALYSEESDQGALLFLEAKIYKDGLSKPKKAFDLFKNIYENYPNLADAPSALLSAASLAKELGRLEEAKSLYKLVVKEYQSVAAASSEAEWQLAKIEEESGNWREASLQYKSISRKYPTTIQGLEAPLRIAAKYKEDNEPKAARAAYLQAVESYEKLLSPQYPPAIKILAEEYIVRAYVEMEQWQESVDRLLALPDRYPAYSRFRMNFLTAASILEEKIMDKEGAIKTLEACIERYPETEAASEAANQIRRLRDTK